jgi:hypothetical protein
MVVEETLVYREWINSTQQKDIQTAISLAKNC